MMEIPEPPLAIKVFTLVMSAFYFCSGIFIMVVQPNTDGFEVGGFFAGLGLVAFIAIIICWDTT